MHAEQLHFGSRLSCGILHPLFIGLERTRRRMRPRVLPGETWHHRVLEHQRRIAVEEIAPVHALADEEGIVERTIVVGEEDLVVAPAEGGNREWRSAKAHAGGAAAHPERGVGRRDEKLGGWRRRGRRCRPRRRAASGEEEQSAAAEGTTHRGKYTAYGAR